MNTYWTQEIDPKTGEVIKIFGPDVRGITQRDAENYCKNNGLKNHRVKCRLISEVPCNEDFGIDWDKQIYYDRRN